MTPAQSPAGRRPLLPAVAETIPPIRFADMEEIATALGVTLPAEAAQQPVEDVLATVANAVTLADVVGLCTRNQCGTLGIKSKSKLLARLAGFIQGQQGNPPHLGNVD